MTYTEFFNIITDNSFDREKYYYILKKCGYRRTKEYFNKFITDYENNDETYIKCRYYFDDLFNKTTLNYDDGSVLDADKQYIREVKKIPMLEPEEESELLINLVKIKNRIKDLKEKYNIEQLKLKYGININNCENEDLKIIKEYLTLEKDYKKISHKLILSNLRYVVTIANRNRCANVDILDLIQVGNIGLQEAVDNFDINRGEKFNSSAMWYVKKCIIREIQNNSRIVRIPVYKYELLYRVKKAYDLFEKKYSKIPTPQEVVDYIKEEVRAGKISDERNYSKITVKTIEELNMIFQCPISMYAKVGETGDAQVLDFLIDEEQETVEEIAEKKDMCSRFDSIIRELKPKKRIVIVLHFGFDLNKYITYEEFLKCFKSIKFDDDYYRNLYNYLCNIDKLFNLKEIGDILGLTREYIRQIKDTTIDKIKTKTLGMEF